MPSEAVTSQRAGVVKVDEAVTEKAVPAPPVKQEGVRPQAPTEQTPRVEAKVETRIETEKPKVEQVASDVAKDEEEKATEETPQAQPLSGTEQGTNDINCA